MRADVCALSRARWVSNNARYSDSLYLVLYLVLYLGSATCR